ATPVPYTTLFRSDRRVGTEQRPVVLQSAFEQRLPPGEFELGGDPLLRHVTHREIGEQWAQTETGERVADLRALDEVVEHGGAGGEAGEGAHETRDGEGAERLAATQCAIEISQFRRDPLPRDMHIGESERNLRCDPRLHVALPLRALLLDAKQ